MHIPQNDHHSESLHASISVETRILGWGADRLDIPLPAAPIRVADFIRLKVGLEWEQRRAGLRERVGTESTPPEDLMAPARPSGDALEDAVFAALDGYRAGWYVILVDGAPTTGLDQRLALTADSTVHFVRVYPLPDARGG